jgi:hypothetical protein
VVEEIWSLIGEARKKNGGKWNETYLYWKVICFI